MKIQKKIIAREVLVFFGCIATMIVLCLFAMIKNAYYNHEISKVENRIKPISDELSNLPTDYLWNEYNKIKNNFRYILTTGPILVELKSDGQEWGDSDIPIIDRPDNIIEPISFGEFSKKIKEPSYLLKLNRTKGIYIDAGRAIKSIGYNYIVYQKTKELNDKIDVLKNESSKHYQKILSTQGWYDYILSCTVIIFIVAYIIRLSIISVIWAFRIMKKEREPHNTNTAAEY